MAIYDDENQEPNHENINNMRNFGHLKIFGKNDLFFVIPFIRKKW